MIECTESNIYYKKRKRKRIKRKFLAFFLIFIILFSCFFYYNKVIYNNLYKINSAYAYKCCTLTVNEVILFSLLDGVKYTDIISVEKNDNGDVSLITANTYKINLISQEIAQNSASALENKLDIGTPISILAFSGIGAISGFGREVYIKTLNVSSVVCKYNSKFTSMGINQTLHSIYVDVVCLVDINLPLKNDRAECVVPILLSETVLVGKVPETVINGNLFD